MPVKPNLWAKPERSSRASTEYTTYQCFRHRVAFGQRPYTEQDRSFNVMFRRRCERAKARHATVILFDDTEVRFRELAEKWRDETWMMSTVRQISMNGSYQHIIGMGWKAVPLILVELRDRPNHWFWALNAITGVDPAPEDGNLRAAREAWLRWGADAGYIDLG
jgi:hypothetical protein